MLQLEEKFFQILDNLNISIDKVALAVSGGADSMALLALSVQWAKNKNVIIEVLVVNHGLRLYSLNEAILVKNYCTQTLNVTCTILNWEGKKPVSNLQSQARKARYYLMYKYCLIHNIKFLFTGHHLDDQAETFLIRLERGSGLDGLCSIPLLKYYYSICLVRPLLFFPKEELTAYLKKQQIKWVEDESNNNLKYKRSVFRNLLVTSPLLKQRIALACSHLRQAREAIDFYIKRAFKDYVSISPLGYLKIDVSIFLLPDEINSKVLVYSLMLIGGKEYKPRFKNFSHLLQIIKNKQLTNSITFQGCKIILADNEIFLIREVGAISEEVLLLSPYTSKLWDKRFLCKNNTIHQPLLIKKITPQFITDNPLFLSILTEKYKLNKTIARQILLTLPSSFDLYSYKTKCPLLEKLELANKLTITFNAEEKLNSLLLS